MAKELNPIDVLKNVETLVEQYDALQERVDELEGECGELGNAIDDLQERVEELEEERDELQERVNDLQAFVKQLQEERDALRARLSAAMCDIQ